MKKIKFNLFKSFYVLSFLITFVLVFSITKTKANEKIFKELVRKVSFSVFAPSYLPYGYKFVDKEIKPPNYDEDKGFYTVRFKKGKSVIEFLGGEFEFAEESTSTVGKAVFGMAAAEIIKYDESGGFGLLFSNNKNSVEYLISGNKISIKELKKIGKSMKKVQ